MEHRIIAFVGTYASIIMTSITEPTAFKTAWLASIIFWLLRYWWLQDKE